MKIIIVGGGDTGRSLSNVLANEGHSVILIEQTPETAQDIAEKTNALIINRDGTNVETMKEAKIEEADVVIAATNDDKTNLMVCEIAKSFNVPKIISRVNSIENESLFKSMDYMVTVQTVQLIIEKIKDLIEQDTFRTIAILSSGDYQIIEIKVNEGSKAEGMLATQFPKGVIGLVQRSNLSFIPTNRTRLTKDDKVVIIVKTTDLEKVTRLFQ